MRRTGLTATFHTATAGTHCCAAEYAGAPATLLWTGGLVLLLGRMVHYFTIRRYGWAIGRAIGMALTFLPMVGFALYSLATVSGLIS